MAMPAKLTLQFCGFGVTGIVGGAILLTDLPTQTAAEIVQAVGNLSLIAGSLVGWSVGWISQSRGLIRDVDYNKAREIFQQLGDLQLEIIWRWWIVFVCSLLAVACSIFVKMPNLRCIWHWHAVLLSFGSGMLMVSVFFVCYLFQRMLALSRLKAELETHERDELRKKNLLPSAEEKPAPLIP